MPRPHSATRELIVAIISALVAVMGAVELIGHPARTVHVLTIFAGAFSSGIAFGRAVDRRRAESRAKASTGAERA